MIFFNNYTTILVLKLNYFFLIWRPAEGRSERSSVRRGVIAVHRFLGSDRLKVGAIRK
jgi:hypothetical protein